MKVLTIKQPFASLIASGFIAKVTLTDCVEVDGVFREFLRKKNFPVYAGTTENLTWKGYGFKLENVERIEPVQTNGKLGLWEYEI